MMKKNTIKKLENIQEYSEEGIKELGREEGIIFNVYNTIKPKKVIRQSMLLYFKILQENFL